MLPSLIFVALVVAGSARAQPGVAGGFVQKIPCASDSTQTYTLYLPTRYEPSRRWPLLLVFDPRGRGTVAAEVFRDAAEAFGWIIISSDNTRSDGPWDPNSRALAALWPGVLQKYPVDPRRVYAAGFSGGATVAWVLARISGAVAGIIATGAPAPRDGEALPGRVSWFGAAGRADFNFLDARELDTRMAGGGLRHRLEFFDGAHQWMTPDVARLAIGWLEVLAMRDNLRPRDEAVARAVMAGEMTRVEQLISAGRLVDARRALGSITASYEGIADLGDATRRIREIDADEKLARARKDEQRGDERERSRRQAAARVLARLRTEEMPYARQFVDELNLSGLQKDARRVDYEGEAARRVLETIYVQTANYIPRQFEDAREFGRAAVSLEIATEIHPDRPIVWVNLAAARAMGGSKKPALSALTRAVEAGFRDADLLARDDRFAPLRGTPEYTRLIETLSRK